GAGSIGRGRRVLQDRAGRPRADLLGSGDGARAAWAHRSNQSAGERGRVGAQGGRSAELPEQPAHPPRRAGWIDERVSLAAIRYGGPCGLIPGPRTWKNRNPFVSFSSKQPPLA